MQLTLLDTESNVSELFMETLKRFGLKHIANQIGLHNNTVKRWIDTGNIPQAYAYDFCRMLGIKPEFDTDKDQYFTRPETAKTCFKMFQDTLKKLKVNQSEYTYIEPSMGEGCFYKILPKERRIGIDIDPRHDEAICSDYLQWKPKPLDCKYLVIGNPPFGLRGHLALQFINHSWSFADAVGFILPQLFGSDGKGVPGKRVKGYRLAFSEILDGDQFSTPDGRYVHINTVFQVWTKVGIAHLPPVEHRSCEQWIKVYSLSDGGTPASTRNKNMIGKCDLYLPSTTFSGMKLYEEFEELPNRRGYGIVILQEKQKIKKLLRGTDWKEKSFKSTNSALNLRRSIIEDVIIQAGFAE